jgi:ribonuclease HI
MKIYCDGSCSGNPGTGGWGAVFIKNDKVVKKVYGYGGVDSTNNKMELTAAIEALKLLKNGDVADIFTDSTYLKNGITEWIKSWKTSNWKNGMIKNRYLWESLDSLNSQLNVKWHWVKAHDGDKFNEMADKLAKQAVIEKVSLKEINL